MLSMFKNLFLTEKKRGKNHLIHATIRTCKAAALNKTVFYVF